MLRALVLVVVLTLSGPAFSQVLAQSQPDTEGGRYTLNRTDDGYLRLDQRTGQVSACTQRDLGWSCHPVPDERAALEDEIARLQRDNAALKKDMLARGITPPGAPKGNAQAKNQADTKSPNDAEIDRAMATVERIWRRLVEMITRLQRDIFTQT